MAMREFRRTGQTTAWDWEALWAYLAAKGYVVGGGGLTTGLDPDDATAVVVRADLDPHVPDATVQADLDAYVPPADPYAAAEVEYRLAIRAVRTADPQTTTAAQWIAMLRRVALAEAALWRRLA